MKPAPFTVVDYLLKRLKQVNVTDFFKPRAIGDLKTVIEPLKDRPAR